MICIIIIDNNTANYNKSDNIGSLNIVSNKTYDEQHVDVNNDSSIISVNNIFESFSNKKNGWGQGKLVDEKNRPLSSLEMNKKYSDFDAVFIGEDNSNIFLTFDEGYENGYTPKILDILKEKSVPAVFFITYDYVNKNPNLVRRMIDEGHVVGNHTYSHPSMPDVSIDKCEEELKKLHDYVYENFNYTMNLCRPPRGEYSERTLSITKSLGYKTIFWSFAYKDWEENNKLGKEESYNRVVNGLHNGAIYLLHAVSKDNSMILSDFIDTARSKGYEFSLY